MILEEILYQLKKSVEVKKYEHPTSTLAMNFLEPTGEENMYILFGYVPHKIFYHTLGQVLGSMNNDTINRIRTSKQSIK